MSDQAAGIRAMLHKLDTLGPDGKPHGLMAAVDQAVTELRDGKANAWQEGMQHALAWLGLRHYGEVMAKDNPYRRKP